MTVGNVVDLFVRQQGFYINDDFSVVLSVFGFDKKEVIFDLTFQDGIHGGRMRKTWRELLPILYKEVKDTLTDK